MSIKHAVLGLLSWQPLSGYDLKKRISSSTAFYWSGNNNQIYKTLIQLQEEGLVTFEEHFQEKGPAKKVYSVTPQGQEELRKWALSTPQVPEVRNTFLIQLAWANELSGEELNSLIDQYDEEVSMHLLMHEEQTRRGSDAPHRTAREAYMWQMISENTTTFLKNELNWARKLRHELKDRPELNSGE